jgi:small-conductance mechanosensitive channel
MIRQWQSLLLLALTLAALPPLTGPAWAQQNPPPPPVTAAHTTITPEQARAALDTLNDPKKRAAFTATLEALANAHSQPEVSPPTPAQATPPATPNGTTPPAGAAPNDPKTTVEGIAIPLAPDSLGAQVLLTASSFLNGLGEEAARAFRTVQSFPLLWGWLVVMFTNPLGQHLLTEAAWRLAAALVVAVGVQLALRRLVRRPMARVLALGQRPEAGPDEAQAAEPQGDASATEPPPRRHGFDGLGRRLGLGLARFALEMVPVLGLLISGHMVAGSSLGGPPDSQLITLAVIEAIAVCQVLLALQTFLFMPYPPGLKLLALRPAVGAYLIRWGRRLILIGVPGYTIGEVGLLLGMSSQAHDALQKTVGLVLLICLSVMAVQRRRGVRRWLSAPPDSTGTLSLLRNRLAKQWYWVALFFMVSTWLSWTLRAPDAIARTLWYFAATTVVLVGAALASMAVTSLIGRIETAPDGDGEGAGYSVRVRLSAYHTALRQAALLAINAVALLGLLQLYGLGGLDWLLATEVGHRVISGLCTLAVTIALAFIVWEGVNIAIQMHLETLRRQALVARSARLRTLLPLVRTALSISIFVVAGLMILSEIGVNIGPLLAGAGIVGVAIGFGSQRLVQDVITGVFLLLENAMQVGDIVRLGDQTGTVESLSVRAIRLRTEDGSVVVIPFSAVTTVINMTRDFSRAVISANIAPGEDVDKAIETMRTIVREMREEDAWGRIILDELEVFGLDRFTDSALLVKCRIMCTPFGRWQVGREFNRRLEMRFEVVGLGTAATALKLVPPKPAVTAEPGQSVPGESMTGAV